MLSPAFTAWPTLATTFRTFPGTEAATFTEPAPAAAFGAAFGAGAALGAAAGLAATGAETLPVSSTVTSYAVPLTVIV